MTVSRRVLLQAMGASTGLLLPILRTQRTEAAGLPNKAVFMFWENGVATQAWTPKSWGFNFQSNYITNPLVPHLSNVVVFDRVTTALNQWEASHNAKLFLTAYGKQSLDNYIASQKATPIKHLNLAAEYPGLNTADWKYVTRNSNGDPIAPIYDLKKAYDYLFAGYTFPKMASGISSTAKAQLSFATSNLKHRKSVMDAVIADFNSMKRYLSGSELTKFNSHFDLVRSVETRLNAEMGASPTPTATPSMTATPSPSLTPRPSPTPTMTPTPTVAATPSPTMTPAPTPTPTPLNAGCSQMSIPTNPLSLPLDQKMPLMIDLMVLALACGRTEVATLLMCEAVSYMDYPFLATRTGFFGTKGLKFAGAPHHEASHYGAPDADSDQLTNRGYTLRQLEEMKTEIDRWHMEMLALLISRLKEFGLFDSTVILLGNAIGGGAHTHSNYDVPFVLASGNPVFRTGQALNMKDTSNQSANHSSILSAVAKGLGYSVNFGRSDYAQAPFAKILA